MELEILPPENCMAGHDGSQGDTYRFIDRASRIDLSNEANGAVI